jgi:hypothetical protein
MWGRFFDSIGQEDTESVMSGSHMPANRSAQNVSHLPQSPYSEVHPDDSASVGDDEHASALDGYPRKTGAAVQSSTGPVAVPADDGTYVFKFSTPSGRTHRFQARHDDVEHLRDIVSGKLSADPFFAEWTPLNESDIRPDPLDFQLSYTDADGDSVLITSDHDVTDSVKIARAAHTDRVILVIQGGKGWNEKTEKKGEVNPVNVPAPVTQEPKEADNENVPEKASIPSPSIHVASDDVMGIPKDLLLPASIGALAVVIVGVFAISRFTSSRW